MRVSQDYALRPRHTVMVDNQLFWFIGLGAWAFVIVMAIKPLHAYMMSKGCENMVAVYYNRKVAHMVLGGIPLIMCPIVFTDPIYPLLGGDSRGNWSSIYSSDGQATLVDAN